jgi:hypothetical protein
MDVTGSILTATPPSLRTFTEASTGRRSCAEGAPVAHNRYKPISLDAPERGDDRTARDTVFTGQLRHRGQPLLWLPFARADSRT